MDSHAPAGQVGSDRQGSGGRAGGTPDNSFVAFAQVANSPPIIPDYALLKCIGRGSYGEVWMARSVLGELRAVKVVYRRSFEDARPFEREFEGIKNFEPISRIHESQVDILHVGRNDEEGYFFYVMELADDGNAKSKSEDSNGEGHQRLVTSSPTPEYIPHTLKLEMVRRGRLPLEDCIQIGLSLMTALEHLHSHGLVHRDVKPSNIIFIKGVPKLADIGLVSSFDATMSFVGTAGYFPPEGPGKPTGDIYSLGKVLYELSVGRNRGDFLHCRRIGKSLQTRKGFWNLTRSF